MSELGVMPAPQQWRKPSRDVGGLAALTAGETSHPTSCQSEHSRHSYGAAFTASEIPCCFALSSYADPTETASSQGCHGRGDDSLSCVSSVERTGSPSSHGLEYIRIGCRNRLLVSIANQPSRPL